MRIDLALTRQLHEELSRRLPMSQESFEALIRTANDRIRSRGVTFGGEKEMPIALSALVLRPDDVSFLRRETKTLFSLLEKAVDWLVASEDRLIRFAPDHRRMIPWLRRSPGTTTWQLFSRYDAVVTPQGKLRFIEFNTGCPAGFMHAVDFSDETRRIFSELSLPITEPKPGLGMIRPAALGDMIVAAEGRSGLEPGLIGILTDENELKLELDLLQRDLNSRGRDAEIIDARKLTWDGQRLKFDGRIVSAVFNKVRISTEQSPHHCWRAGFEERYSALLKAVASDAVVSINNLCALSVAEDKGMLALLHQPEVQGILTPDERHFVETSIPWTARLQDGDVYRHGKLVSMQSLLRESKDDLVIKPANEGRGFEVHIGRLTSAAEWESLSQPNATLPMVVQDFIEPVSFPVACLREGGVRLETMHLTVALAVVDGTYEGILSRISPSVVTNVGRQGFVQAVLVTDR